MRRVLDILFSGRGYDVTCFADAAGLFAAIQRQSPACIILDVHIPGKSGLDVLKEFKYRNYPAPVFMISGKGDIAMAVDAKSTARSISSKSRSAAPRWLPVSRRPSPPNASV